MFNPLFLLFFIVLSPIVSWLWGFWALYFLCKRPRHLSNTAVVTGLMRWMLVVFPMGKTHRQDAALVAMARHFTFIPYKLTYFLTAINYYTARICCMYLGLHNYDTLRTKLINLVTVRVKYLDSELIEKINKCTQFVHLGAGLDTQTLRPEVAEKARAGTLKVFEVDHPGTQKVKKAALEKCSEEVDNKHVEYVAVDFMKEDWLDVLVERHGFSLEEPTFVLWEGVTYYLSNAVVLGTLKNVSKMAVGSSVAFDYPVRSRWTYLSRFVFWVIREPFLFNIKISSKKVDDSTMIEGLKNFVQDLPLALSNHLFYKDRGFIGVAKKYYAGCGTYTVVAKEV